MLAGLLTFLKNLKVEGLSSLAKQNRNPSFKINNLANEFTTFQKISSNDSKSFCRNGIWRYSLSISGKNFMNGLHKNEGEQHTSSATQLLVSICPLRGGFPHIFF